MTDTPWEKPWIGFLRYRLGPGRPWASGRVEYRSPIDYGIEFHEVFVASNEDERALSAVVASILASCRGDRAEAREISVAAGVEYGIAWGARPGEIPRFLRRRGPLARTTGPEVTR